jgi:uncharacterized protein VirK/YbjX
LATPLAAGREVDFGRVALTDGQGELPLRLGKQPRFEREGELTLSLIDPFGSLLYSACVTWVEDDGRLTWAPGDPAPPASPPPARPRVALLVGSLNGTAPRDVLRHLTKLGHGVRPASLMVFLLQQLAALSGAEALLGVGRHTHAYWGHPRHAAIRFDYDAFWQEEGGEQRDDGLWSLPVQPRRRSPSEVPGQKRAQYLRRYAWLDEVAAELRGRWASAERGP